MSDIGLPGDPSEGRRRRALRSLVRRGLVYFGLADDDPVHPLFPGPTAPESDALAEVRRRLDEQAAAIADLRAEVERLRERP